MIQHIQNALCEAVPFYYVVLAALVFFVIGVMAGKKWDVPAQLDREEFSRCVQLIMNRYEPNEALNLFNELEVYCSDLRIERLHLSAELIKIIDEVVKDV